MSNPLAPFNQTTAVECNSELHQQLITEGRRQLKFYGDKHLNDLIEAIPNAKTEHWRVIQEPIALGGYDSFVPLALLRIEITDFKYFWKKIVDAGKLSLIADALLDHTFIILLNRVISTKVGNIWGSGYTFINNCWGTSIPLSEHTLNKQIIAELVEVLAEDIEALYELNCQVFWYNNEVQKKYDDCRLRIMECLDPQMPVVNRIVQDFTKELEDLEYPQES